MNIEDFPPQFAEEHLPQIWEIIFTKQHALAAKYIPIEDGLGLRWVADMSVNLDSGKGQAQLKDMAWRCMEEVGESLEAFYDERSNQEQRLHAQEELADGLHFLCELGILAGITALDINGELSDFYEMKYQVQSETIDEAVTNFVLRLGTTMNVLKNKPWKQTQYITDKAKFRSQYFKAFEAYVLLMLQIMEPIDILNLYFRKSQVNDFRQRSKY